MLKGRTQPLVLPLNFPDAPNVSSPEAALNVSLADLRHWYLAPTNPAQLAAAGVPFAITADGLSSLTQFLPNLRTAVARGLAPDKALAALTTVPATFLGIEKTHGTIAVGKAANLVISDGDLFTEESSVRDVWVQGRQYGVTRPPQVDPRGTWTITSDDAGTFKTATLRLEGPLNRIRGTIEMAGRRAVPLTSVRIIAETGRLEATFAGEPLGQEGAMLLAGSVSDTTFFGWLSLPNGTDARYRGTRTEAFTGPARGTVAVKVPKIDLPFIRPSMEFGRTSAPAQPAVLLVRNATVWTQGPQGRMENADLLVQAGKIVRVGQKLAAPAGAVIVDATGKHVTPGLIDPHTHSGVSAVNESGFRDRARSADGRRHHAQQHLVLSSARRRSDHHDDPARLGQSDRRRERVREDALGLAARRVQDRGCAAHGEVRARRESEAQPDALSEHAYGRAGNHSRSLPGRA